ncbi:hypothetical protein Tco_0728706 [Tanacetum coccineum]|uniref:Uncharacterized protein n=1 Tax=Tanacetum coccineum TaxID=301880 RepID=A0ABQ4YMD0_9ASTR
MLKVSPRKGIIHLDIEGQEERLNPRTFHVSNLKKCLSDESLVIPMKELRLDDNHNFVEEPVEIMANQKSPSKLKQSRLFLSQSRWESKRDTGGRLISTALGAVATGTGETVVVEGLKYSSNMG